MLSTQPPDLTAGSAPPRQRAPAPGEAATRTATTERNYLSRAIWFEVHTSRNLSIPNPSPLVVAAYALERREEWAKSTWRQNKAALTFRYTAMGTTASLQAVEILRDGDQSICASKTGRTSAKRSKAVSPLALEKVIALARGSTSRYASLLETWLLLGGEVGLRPHEWGQAELIFASPHDLGDIDAMLPSTNQGESECDETLVPYLRILNSKSTNVRGHGTYRHLNLSLLHADSVNAVGRFAALMTDVVNSGSYELYYASCCKLLWRINKVIHGKSMKKWVQLYSPRHKFSSDAKKMLGSEGVAALMGHATTKTASEHYGRRTSANGSLGPRPVASEVIRVRQVRNSKARAIAAAPIVSVTVEVQGLKAAGLEAGRP